MTPLTPPTAQAGDGLVNATALDGVIHQIVARINALISALGVARGEDRLLADGSVKWRMFNQRARDDIAEMARQVGLIRQNFKSDDLQYNLDGKTIISEATPQGQAFSAFTYDDKSASFTVDGPAEVLYRVKFRLRTMAMDAVVNPGGFRQQHPFTFEKDGGVPTVLSGDPIDLTVSSPLVGAVLNAVVGAEYNIPMILSVDTTKTSTGSTAATHFKLPLTASGVYNFVVDWGDGNTDTITAWDDAAKDHAYAAPGVYTVSILGACWGWQFADTGDKLKPLTLSQWGNGWRFTIGCAAGQMHWYGCANLVVTATDTPNMARATSLRRSFRDCALLTGIGNQAWDLSGVDSINSMFESDPVFNQDIGAWDVSNITNMFTLFNDSAAFNNGGSDSIKNWDTSKVVYLWATFKGTAFNQPIGSWNVSGCYYMDSTFKSTPFNHDLSGWDVSNVTTMAYMFNSAAAFNQDISGWNVERVASFNDMFGIASAFRRNVGAWWMRGASNGFNNMFFLMDMNIGGSPTNLATNAQDFPNANWTKTNLTATANTATAPDGSTTADSLKPSVTNSTDHSVRQLKTVVIGTAYTVRVALKASQLTWGQLICSGAITANVYVNLSTGAIESSTGSVSVTDIGNGWYVLEITGTASTTSLTMQIKAWNNATGTSFAGNASDAIFAWQASMFTSDGKSLDNYSAFLRDITGWTGSGDGSANRTGVTAAAVAVGGSGYTVGDVLTVVGGTLGVGTKSAEVKVATINGAGAVLTVTVKRGCGNYDTQPANAAATTGGTGNGCTLNLTWGSKFAGLPTSTAFHGGLAKYNMKDRLAMNARKNLVLATGSGGKGWTVTDGGPL